MIIEFTLLLASAIGSGRVADLKDALVHYQALEKGAQTHYRRSMNQARDPFHEVTASVREGESVTVTIAYTHTIDWDKVFNRVPAMGKEEIEIVTTPLAKLRLKPNGIFHVASYEKDRWRDFGEKSPCLLRLPIKIGESWNEENESLKHKTTRTVEAIERIKVAAGEFETVRIGVVATLDGKQLAAKKYWFAKGIGVVKSTIGNETTLELSKFTRPK